MLPLAAAILPVKSARNHRWRFPHTAGRRLGICNRDGHISINGENPFVLLVPTAPASQMPAASVLAMFMLFPHILSVLAFCGQFRDGFVRAVSLCRQCCCQA